MNDIIENPFKSISILYRKSHIWLNSGCVKFNLTAAQASVILIVCDFEELTQDDITKRLGLDKSVVAKTVTKLIETGFVVRKTNKKDKRTYDVSPTDKSWGVYSFIKEQIDECFSKMTYKMTDDEREEFRRLLVVAAETTIGIDE